MAFIELKLSPRISASFSSASPAQLLQLVAGPIARGTPGVDAGLALEELLNSTTDNTTISGATPAMVTMDRPGPNTITLPTRVVDPTLVLRRPYLLRQRGMGATTLVAGAGALFVMADGLTTVLADQHAAATAMLVDDATWWLFGALKPA